MGGSMGSPSPKLNKALEPKEKKGTRTVYICIGRDFFPNYVPFPIFFNNFLYKFFIESFPQWTMVEPLPPVIPGSTPTPPTPTGPRKGAVRR